MNISQIAMTSPYLAIIFMAISPSLPLTSQAGELNAKQRDKAVIMQNGKTIFDMDTQLIRKSFHLDWAFEPSDIINAFERGAKKNSVYVPSELKLYASGLSSKSWIFSAGDINLKFQRLFQIIATSSLWGFNVQLNRNDLFHGHIFTFNYENATDIAILFHSKEYPNDSDLVAQNNGLGEFNNYNSSSSGYIHRNFLWLNKPRLLINFNGFHIEEHTKELFLPFGAESLPQDLMLLFLKSKTVQTERIPGFQKKLGDVNFFGDSAFTEPLLFFTYVP
jgi:hypothetical protein